MLSKQFQEEESSELRLPDKKIEEIEWMLDFIYPDAEFQLTGETKETALLKELSLHLSPVALLTKMLFSFYSGYD